MNEPGETRQERRAQKLKSRRDRMAKHGASLRRIYVDAVLKRAQKRSRRRR